MESKRALRIDFAGPLDRSRVLPDGTVRIPALLARTGVLEYTFTDGSTRREYRPPEEVFAADSLETWPGLALTIDHPASPVGPSTWGDLAVGHVADKVQREDRDGVSYLAGECVVKRGDAISQIAAGDLVEVSCGYFVEIDPTPGTTADGEAYDVIQRGIVGNHVALGPSGWGRSGESVRLYGGDSSATVRDLAVGVSYPWGASSDNPEIDRMSVRTDNAAPAAAPSAPATVQTAVVPLAEFERVSAERDALRTEVASLKSTTSAAEVAADSKIAERVKIRVEALRVDAKIDTAKSDRDVMIATITASGMFPTFKSDGASEEAIRARFDLACEQHAARADASSASHAALGALVAARGAEDHTPGTGARADGGGASLIETARAKMNARNAAAAKRPAGKG